MSANAWTVDFWLDPACPLTRRTARWITSIADGVPLQVRWRVMSLALLDEEGRGNRGGTGNSAADVPREPAGVAAAVQAGHGHAALVSFYDALWTAQDGMEQEGIGDIADALRRCELPAGLADGDASVDGDAVLRASHSAGVGGLEGRAGSPILALTAPYGRRETIVGPVLETTPAPADAMTLWKATVLLSGIPGFREIRR